MLLLKKYFNEIEKFDKDTFCATSSIVLEMFNLRTCKDLDYLHITNQELHIDNIGLHRGQWLDFYHTNAYDLIYNPENFFYFNGFKFASIEVIKQMKLTRNENKDINDVNLLTQLLTYYSDQVIYINLDERIDRKEHMEKNVLNNFLPEKVLRYSAIKHIKPYIGCTKSHIACLNIAIENNYENVMILEDDAMWNDYSVDGIKILSYLLNKPF
jgi:hypothetical protein